MENALVIYPQNIFNFDRNYSQNLTNQLIRQGAQANKDTYLNHDGNYYSEE